MRSQLRWHAETHGCNFRSLPGQRTVLSVHIGAGTRLPLCPGGSEYNTCKGNTGGVPRARTFNHPAPAGIVATGDRMSMLGMSIIEFRNQRNAPGCGAGPRWSAVGAYCVAGLGVRGVHSQSHVDRLTGLRRLRWQHLRPTASRVARKSRSNAISPASSCRRQVARQHHPRVRDERLHEDPDVRLVGAEPERGTVSSPRRRDASSTTARAHQGWAQALSDRSVGADRTHSFPQMRVVGD